MPKHGAGRHAAAVTFTPEAAQQVRALVPEEAKRLDAALVVIAADPLGAAPPMEAAPMLRDYRDGDARVVYYATVLGHVVVVAFLEA
ncbi:type II toxin-antitoxin system RelE/ParE family toxin [Kitasatospora sp. NPDC087861]|uniref:type II toxin-antitoxin system RelE family toxin n=1 Tax=Kitasatospora sp. NPDC087861 TaxID=3364070 RepID=UPI003820309F